ncbi:MAG: Ni/Fe hydrogenase subunit alpha [Desulfomonilaceae bacterium]
MAKDAKIKVHHITRVEGHGDISAEIKNGRLVDVRFAIVEAPRLFEAFLLGRSYDEVTHIAPRVCGICSVSHKCAALKATETALGVEITEQTLLLRRLAFHGEVISSHILHIYFLAGPDFFDVASVFPLVESRPDVVRRAMRMKKLAYDLCSTVLGRHTHPVAMTVGGFTFVQSDKRLAAMRERLKEGLEDVKATVKLFKTINLPKFERETQYVSLKHPAHYAFYDGNLFCSDGESVPAGRYREYIREHVVPYSTAKHADRHRSKYMVGALARINNNHGQLSPLALEAARDLGIRLPCHNPFANTFAQIVECAHCLEDSIHIINMLLERGIRAAEEQAEVAPRSGRGVGAVEAPRGTLFHEYEYGANGKCIAANLVIPTAQNLANLEADMRAYVPAIIEQTEESIAHELEMLVRAYDPCISCSTHVILAT